MRWHRAFSEWLSRLSRCERWSAWIAVAVVVVVLPLIAAGYCYAPVAWQTLLGILGSLASLLSLIIGFITFLLSLWIKSLVRDTKAEMRSQIVRQSNMLRLQSCIAMFADLNTHVNKELWTAAQMRANDICTQLLAMSGGEATPSLRYSTLATTLNEWLARFCAYEQHSKHFDSSEQGAWRHFHAEALGIVTLDLEEAQYGGQ